MKTHELNKEAFFLRHTAHLPSSTSQLVLFHHPSASTSSCFLGGSTSMFTLGVHFHVHFQGVHSCSLPGGSTSMFTSRGSTSMFTSGCPLPCSLLGEGSTSVFTLGGSTSMFISGGGSTSVSLLGVHFHVHLRGGPLPCSLLGGPMWPIHNALIYHHRMPQRIMGKIHMGLPLELSRLTDRQTWLKHYLPALRCRQ